MKNNSKYIKFTFLLMFLMIIPMSINFTFGQTLPPPPPPQPGVPIDGGLTLLLAGLGAYGAKKIFTKKED